MNDNPLDIYPTAQLIAEIDKRIVATVPVSDKLELSITTSEICMKLGIDKDMARRAIRRLKLANQIHVVIRLHPTRRTVCGKGYLRRPPK